jgi:hypothetical protein
MRGLKATTGSSTTTTSTLKGKRKLAQAKDYPDSPPNGTTTTTKIKKQVNEVNSPPSKRRRSSDRIANKQGTKRQSMEDDDGFVFTRAPKQRRKAAVEVEPLKPVKPTTSKPFRMDFMNVLLSSFGG